MLYAFKHTTKTLELCEIIKNENTSFETEFTFFFTSQFFNFENLYNSYIALVILRIIALISVEQEWGEKGGLGGQIVLEPEF